MTAAKQKGHVITDRFCHERTGEWTTGRMCPICRNSSVCPDTVDLDEETEHEATSNASIAPSYDNDDDGVRS